MSDRFAVEADRAVVGVAVRVKDGFQFFSSDPDFRPLEGKTFSRIRSLTHRLARHSRRLRGSRMQPPPTVH